MTILRITIVALRILLFVMGFVNAQEYTRRLPQSRNDLLTVEGGRVVFQIGMCFCLVLFAIVCDWKTASSRIKRMEFFAAIYVGFMVLAITLQVLNTLWLR
jgi:hypothetical protein